MQEAEKRGEMMREEDEIKIRETKMNSKEELEIYTNKPQKTPVVHIPKPFLTMKW